MITRSVSLEEIFEINDRIIWDGSAHQTHGIFLRHVYDIDDLNRINKELLVTNIGHVQDLIDIIERPKISIIPEVIDELRRVPVILGEKLAYYTNSQREFGNAKRSRKHSKSRDFRANQRRNENEELMKELQESYYGACELSKLRRLEISDPRYNLLVDMVKQIERSIRLKVDNKEKYNPNKKKSTSISDVDEKITAALYWSCLFTDQKSSILTSDSDFVRLLGISSRLIGSDELLPYNESFRDGLIRNPFRLYLCHEGAYEELMFDQDFESEFVIRSRTMKYSDMVKGEILYLLEQFQAAS